MSDIGFYIAEGFLEIQDGIYEIDKRKDEKERRGLVRQEISIFEVGPKFTLSSKKSFQVDVTCINYASIIKDGIPLETKNIIRKDTTYRRVAGKNYLRDIKNFVCKLSDKKQASLLRKRLIGLEKIHKTISNEKFRFPI